MAVDRKRGNAALKTKKKLKELFGALKNPSSPWQTTSLVGVIAFAYLFRARQYFLNPQLYAEDGVLWLAEGYNKSILALFEPVNGFLHFPERLFGFIVAHLPLHFAPIIFVTTAWLLFIFLAYYLLSQRTKILTRNFERIFMVGFLCLIANIEVFFFNFSNSIFLLGIIGLLVMVAKPPRNKLFAIGEKTLFFISCLTLAFAWFYLPIALFERFKHKQKNTFFLYSSIVGSIIQFIYYLLFHVDRSHVTILSLFSNFTLLEIYNQIIIPAVRFTRIDIPILEFTTQPYLVYFVALAIISLLLSSWFVLKKSNKQVWYLLFFLVAMTFAVIKSPTVDVKLAEDALKHMAIVEGAGRYFIFGIIAVNIIFVKTSYLALTPRARYIFAGIFLGLGFMTSLQYKTFYIEKDFVDYSSQYRTSINRFESKEVDKVVIPVNPYPWHLTLEKK